MLRDNCAIENICIYIMDGNNGEVVKKSVFFIDLLMIYFFAYKLNKTIGYEMNEVIVSRVSS